jgi:predicted DNA-binding ribbon-helix-helix protein
MSRDQLATRNLQVGSGRTTIAVEPECWQMLIDISKEQKTTLHVLIQEIDSGRGKASRASAIRLYIMNYYRSLAIGKGFGVAIGRQMSVDSRTWRVSAQPGPNLAPAPDHVGQAER